MALFEILTLDGLTLTGDPTGSLVIEQFGIQPPKLRPEWLSAADSEGAALAREPLPDNREISLRVRVGQQATMDQAFDQVGQLRDKLRKAARYPDGVAMTWTPAGSARTVTLDVLAGEITDLPVTWNGDDVGWFQRRPPLNATLTCRPYWRGTEVLTSSTSASAPVVTMQVGPIVGDAPALGRLIVTDAATQNRRHLEWGLENPDTYNSSTSLLLDSDSLVTAGFAGAGTTRSGAYDPGAAGSSVIRGTFYTSSTVGPQAYCGTGVQTHVGTFRVKARIYSTTTDAVLRFSWQYGDGPFYANAWMTPVVANAWSEIDFGEIVIPTVAAGTQRWSGRVEGTGVIGETVDVDYLELIPVDAGYGKVRASYKSGAGSVAGRDEFTATTAAGVLNARVAPAGGTWATSGSTTDFTFADGPLSGEESVTRASINDTGGLGRTAILGTTNYTDVDTAVQFQRSIGFGDKTSRAGVIARYVDGSNLLVVYIRQWANSTTSDELYVDKEVAGVYTTIARSGPFASHSPNRWYQIRVVVFASGFFNATLFDSPGNLVAQANGTDSVLATGGTLATGKPGFVDYHTNANTASRYYDMFYVATPPAEPIAMYSGRTLEVRHNDTIRQDSTGVYYGRPPAYRGSRFTIPPGTSRVLVKARRYDVDIAQDEFVTDSTQVQVAYTPRGLVVPR